MRSGRTKRLVISGTALLMLWFPGLSAAGAADDQGIPFRLERLAKVSMNGARIKGKMAIVKRTWAGNEQAFLCVGGGSHLFVFDIADPAEPRLMAKHDLTGDDRNKLNGVFEVIHAGDHLVLAGSYQAGREPKGGSPPYHGLAEFGAAGGFAGRKSNGP